MGAKKVQGPAPAFAPIETDALDEFGLLPEQRLAPGTILQEQGATSNKLFLIRDGVVKMVYTDADGFERILGLRSSGWLAGACQAVTNTASTCSVITITACKVGVLEGEAFHIKMKDGGPLCHRVMCMFAQELSTTREFAKQVMSSSAEERLRIFLQESLGHPANWNTVDAAPMMRQFEIAQLLGISPEHLSRLTNKLRNKTSSSGALNVARGG
jgi:CRP-like cAMP-binding protein